VEYDLALNEQKPGEPYRGLLNLGIARRFGENVDLKFGLRDLLGLHRGYGFNRVFDISFHQHF
jgi:hypothetical protein